MIIYKKGNLLNTPAIRLELLNPFPKLLHDIVHIRWGKRLKIIRFMGIQVVYFNRLGKIDIKEILKNIEELDKDDIYTNKKARDQYNMAPHTWDGKYCTCKDVTDTWFDRSQTTNEQGIILQDMCTRCCKCGKEYKGKI